MRASATPDPLLQLAAARGVAVSYEDAFDTIRSVGPETLLAVLAALGEPVERPSDAAECLARGRRRAPAPPPVVVAWEGHLESGALARLRAAAGERAPARLELEDGSEANELLQDAAGPAPADRALPFGVHRLLFGAVAVLIVAAPAKARSLEPASWGLFAPTYALVDEREKGTGDLRCLARLGTFAGSLGASYLATLPLLADYSTADSPGAVASPYSPLSRMWWNEAYLDTSALTGVSTDEPVTQRPAAGGFADVAAAASATRAILARLVATGYPVERRRRSAYERFQRDRPDLNRYAAFRAAAHGAGIDRDAWPSRWIAGDIRPGTDVAADEFELHRLAQWLTDEQVAGAAAATAAAGCRLMLDLPIGCRPDGYDAWAFPASFAGGSPEVRPRHGVSVGAPPDRFFRGGQDWGFRPLDPEGERRAGYPVLRGALAHLLSHAGALRIDHILGFQRLWWIPAGAGPSEGAYVNYPADELLAIACLEAWRHDATLIGEDLGTVDPEVRRLMGEHEVAGMSVAVFDLEARPGEPLEPTAGACALVDTHDTATFAAWFDGSDIDGRLQLGLIDEATAVLERANRSSATRALLDRLGLDEGDARQVHAVLLEELGRSQAGVVIATLEDLWAEHDPQNIPGTVSEHVNFARRLTEPLPLVERDEQVSAPLRRLHEARRASLGQTGASPPAVGAPAVEDRGACAGAVMGKVER